ncbi:bacteriohemerythrin [Noviherbaspirillum galbum]|uniref:Hemerythrin family protein n=1 Tax=Noviherbaspirillum galbum TaxID=2709383 RepID=A0A6B3SKF5_9BURK|nr:hemerythrin family protein [Noviherbaspirillum galbum]NEX61230.1 hemerythrin family protein [Noviherbaspirillum galbum]
METMHRELFSTLEELSLATDAEFGRGYSELVRKVERVFQREEQWMEDCNYAGLATHREQHARVLGGLHHVHGMVMHGDLATGRRVVDELLPQWLAFHTSTMDASLAAAMQMMRGTTAPTSTLS